MLQGHPPAASVSKTRWRSLVARECAAPGTGCLGTRRLPCQHLRTSVHAIILLTSIHATVLLGLPASSHCLLVCTSAACLDVRGGLFRCRGLVTDLRPHPGDLYNRGECNIYIYMYIYIYNLYMLVKKSWDRPLKILGTGPLLGQALKFSSFVIILQLPLILGTSPLLGHAL